MSLSIQKMVSDGTLSTIVLGVQYLQRNDVYMRIDGVETPQSGAPSGYTWSFVDNNTIHVLPVVPTGVEVVVYRRTDLDAMYNIYSQNAQFDESTIDENNQQLLYIAQEYFEQGVPAQLVDSVEYVREDTTSMYYRLKLSDGKYTAEFTIPKGGAAGFEALRRTYADAGLRLLDGSFETGGTLSSATDVLLHNVTAKAYAWTGAFPHVVAPGTDPALPGSGYVPRTDVVLRSELSAPDGSMLSGHKLRTVYAELSDFHNAGGYSSISACIADSPDKSTVFIPSGDHGESIDNGRCGIVGDGYSTVLVPDNGYAVKMKQSIPHWERRSISNLRVSGAPSDTGFTYDPADEIAGRWDLSYIGITGVGIGISKPQGNIGNTYHAINFRSVDRGYVSTDGTIGVMHSGCDRFSDCYWQDVDTWCVDITCKTDGGGQIVIADSVMEQCGGGGIRADFGGKTPYTPLQIRNVWFEEIAKSATVTRNGVVEIPRQIKLIDTPVAFAENCYLNNIELINSNLIANGCRFDSASTSTSGFVIDNNSSMVANDVYANGSPGISVTVNSVTRQSMVVGGGNTAFRGEAPTSRMYKPVGSTGMVADSYTGEIGVKTWTFGGTQTLTAHCVDDGTLSRGCAELVIPPGSTQVSPVASTQSGKWYVFGVDIKVMSGQLTAAFAYDTSFGTAYTIAGKWVTSFGIVKSNSASNVALSMQATTDSTVRLQNFFIVEFDSETDALSFCNSRTAIG